MFTKEDIQKMFADNEGKKYTIYTNNPNGKGINGIDYTKFNSHREFFNQDSYKHVGITISVTNVTDTIVSLFESKRSYRLTSDERVFDVDIKHKTIYLPISSIVSIEFEYEKD